ncbi:hypothetical protein Back11_34090 [Paenibacillus baekrokdamisoli]|uniref:Uncharacterized protein n=1 Tax=Paenibacillus baekrokdamisoli TaxID=1712516 RepID=A0A3G9JFY6_9BACL|nr:hypothetical protein [Paenibacillus baekrokdamisoli]MBB3070999.1 hypothetical protein [Paenibacillus baekrokdamisoli]BBH22064.1 hypothetical protein Back11_34090 [Paenibacillus baekrokdamisoli]
MAISISVLITGVCSVLLYIALLHKVREHHRYVVGLPSADVIQTKLQTGFVGFVFCLEVVGYPHCAKWIEPLKQMIEQQGLEVLVFDGQIIFSERMEIAQMLKIEQFPCVVAVNTNNQYDEQMFIHQMHIDQDNTAIQHFITNKLGVFAL